MSFSRTYSGLVDGVRGNVVTVETHIDDGLPGVHIVGLPDQAVRESRERIRPALKESGFSFPNRKITVNLSPADKAKQGSTYDLPIAVGILLASDQLEVEQATLERCMLVGEIALDGGLRGIPGVLPLALAADREDFEALLIPNRNFFEAEPADIRVGAAKHLREAVALLEGRVEAARPERPEASPADPSDGLDFKDVRGQESAKRGLCLAAAGGHNVLMVGPPGTGKSMLARRVPGILPPLTREEALETTSVHSVAGELLDRGNLVEIPPFRDPHHSISGAGLIGGGQTPRPGEASLAHNGVLFLDELPEFQRSILETLRQPLETGRIHLSRASGSQTFPARFLLLGAMNPCPCGYLTHPDRNCICRPSQIDRYHGKLSGPLMDRIDLHLSVGPVDYEDLSGGKGSSVDTRTLRKRVVSARDRQAHRYREEAFAVNAGLSAGDLDRYCALDESAHRLLEEAVDRRGYSARTVHRLRKVGRTMADLNGDEAIDDRHMAEALQYREYSEDRWVR